MPASGRPNPFPSPALTASADRLRSLAASAESRNAHTAAVRRANAALDDVDVSERTLTGFADKVNKTVEDRIVRALKSSLRDAVGRADTVIKREWERVASVLVDDVRFVFESEDGADSAIDGEEAIGNVRAALDQIATDSDLAGELDSFVSEFIDNRFRSLANNVYVAMLNTTGGATERALETRLTRLSQNFDAAGTGGQSLPPRPQQSAAPAPAPAPRPATSPSGPPPSMPLPTAPAASPRSPPSHPVQSPPPSVPAPVARPQVDSAVSRPNSEAIPPPARPATKPRPKSLATSEMLTPSNARPPPPAERSPIAKARVSTDGGPDSDTEMEQAPAPVPAPVPARGGSGVSADLNRMLAGPPGKYTRPPPPEHEEEVYEEEAMPPRPPARIGVHHDDEDTEDRDLAPSEEVLPPQGHAEVHAEPHRPVPAAREMSVDGSHAPVVASPSVATGHKDKEREKDKHKDKGSKSPKGIRGMLSHLTKSRPKKAKKDSKAEEDEEDAAEVEEVIPEPLVLDELPESFPPPPTGAPPRPAPRPVAHASLQDEAGDAPTRSHAKEASSSSMQSKPSHSRQASTADGPSEEYAEDGESTAPAPVIPAKPRRQPTAAMSALASVMRGRQENDGGATSDADAETSSVGSRNRTSMYSDAGNAAARPLSTYSDASHEPHHQQTAPLSQTSTPAPTPPRPARPTSIAFADQRRSMHESEPQPQSATSPPSGSAEPPRRPPKPVPSPLSQSPTKRKSLVAPEEGSATPQPGHAPSIPPKPAARKSVHLDDAPTGSGEHHPTVPVPRPRPSSMARPPSTATSERPASQFSMHSERRQSTHSTAPDSSSPTHAPETVEEATPPAEESPKPARRIPGVFSTNHGALGALAAAVNGRSAMNRSMSQEIVTESEDTHDSDENAPSRVPMPPRPNQAHAVHEPEPHVQEPVAASPPAPRRTGPPNSGSNPDLYNNGLNFKRNQASTSGDDAAIEKGAVEWLNKHLAPQNVQIDNLFSSLGNGLNLIWSLEDATGESVGKYNKRAMLPVHRLDNLSVALNFCTKKGVSTSFCSPQDIMDGDKGKILTLMNYIMKAWPLS